MRKPTSHSMTEALPLGRIKSEPGRRSPSLEDGLEPSALEHSVPVQNTLTYVLGGAIFAAFLLLILTGVMMTQLYNPSVAAANQSIRYIVERAPLGWFVRGIHYWAAQLVILALVLYVGQVIITGSYKNRRQIIFYAGLLLFLVAFATSFTGKIVKWDQDGYEGLAHLVGIVGLFGSAGRFVAEGAPSTHILTRTYALHVSVLPIIIVVLLAMHFYLIRVGNAVPLGSRKLTETLRRHQGLLVNVGLGIIVLVMLLALLIAPPFGGAPVSAETGIKPPWMFLWLYALENWFGLAGVVYGMIGLFGALAAFPLIDRGEERHPAKRLPALIVLATLAVALVVLSLYAYLAPPAMH